jgi:hypothetical protein
MLNEFKASIGTDEQRSGRSCAVVLAAALLGSTLLFGSVPAGAQTSVDEKPGAAVTEDPVNPISKPIEFEDLGAAISKVGVKMPAGATVLRQATAPLGENGQTLLLNVYKVNNAVWADVLTAKSGQPYTLRNHIRMKTPLAVRPNKMVLTMRYLEPQRRRGNLILAADEAGTLALVFPSGFAGKVMQQNFLASSTDKIKRSYDFSQADSRGFVIVKANVESTGQVTPAEDGQIYVWNGKQFIKRRPN